MPDMGSNKHVFVNGKLATMKKSSNDSISDSQKSNKSLSAAARAYLPSYAEENLATRRAVQSYRTIARQFADPSENWG
jgi:hypothetical protein